MGPVTSHIPTLEGDKLAERPTDEIDVSGCVCARMCVCVQRSKGRNRMKRTVVKSTTVDALPSFISHFALILPLLLFRLCVCLFPIAGKHFSLCKDSEVIKCEMENDSLMLRDFGSQNNNGALFLSPRTRRSIFD